MVLSGHRRKSPGQSAQSLCRRRHGGGYCGRVRRRDFLARTSRRRARFGRRSSADARALRCSLRRTPGERLHGPASRAHHRATLRTWLRHGGWRSAPSQHWLRSQRRGPCGACPFGGASDEELRMPLPGDHFLPAPDLRATRAITINAPSSAVGRTARPESWRLLHVRLAREPRRSRNPQLERHRARGPHPRRRRRGQPRASRGTEGRRLRRGATRGAARRCRSRRHGCCGSLRLHMWPSFSSRMHRAPPASSCASVTRISPSGRACSSSLSRW